jgi:hypothetical protein
MKGLLRTFGQELIDVLGYFFALAFFNAVKEKRDIKTAVFFVFCPHDYAVTINADILHSAAGHNRQNHLNRDLGKRRYIFV